MKTDRLLETILYLCEKSAEDEHFGRTKLNKLLWFADAAAFVRLGESITGGKYQKLSAGPAPVAMKPVLDRALRNGDIEEHTQCLFKHSLARPIARRKAHLSQFSPEQVAILDETVAKYWSMNAGELSNLSHNLPGYRAARMYGQIPIGTAFVTNRPLTAKERTLADDLQNVPAYARSSGD